MMILFILMFFVRWKHQWRRRIRTMRPARALRCSLRRSRAC
ncbi:MAG: hypothetical protein ACTSRW_14575 [Candidatus Helarchaeota archaeon]